jgi:hypothetical protein
MSAGATDFSTLSERNEAEASSFSDASQPVPPVKSHPSISVHVTNRSVSRTGFPPAALSPARRTGRSEATVYSQWFPARGSDAKWASVGKPMLAKQLRWVPGWRLSPDPIVGRGAEARSPTGPRPPLSGPRHPAIWDPRASRPGRDRSPLRRPIRSTLVARARQCRGSDAVIRRSSRQNRTRIARIDLARQILTQPRRRDFRRRAERRHVDTRTSAMLRADACARAMTATCERNHPCHRRGTSVLSGDTPIRDRGRASTHARPL